MTTNAERNAAIAAQQDQAVKDRNPELHGIVELLKACDWPEGEFTIALAAYAIVTPGAEYLCVDSSGDLSEAEVARENFIVQACNYWLHHCRAIIAREAEQATRMDQRGRGT